MTTKMTERDKKLLIFLLTALLIFLFGWVILKPLMEKGLQVKEDALEQERLLEENQKKMDRFMTLQAKVKENEAALEELKRVFYPLMTSQEIDKIFTGAALEKGLQVKNLYINIAKEAQQVQPYVFSARAQKARMTPTVEQPSEGTSADGIEAETSDTVEQEAAPLGPSYILQAGVDLVLTGSRSSLQDILDSFANDYPAVLIENVQWTLTENGAGRDALQESGDADPATLSLKMLLYMYQG